MAQKLNQKVKLDVTILCVEDEEIVRETLAEFLNRRFTKVITAENGVDGLEKFIRYRPDIIITDVVMPKKNGLNMSKEIKEISPSTPIVISTAFDNTDLLIEALNIGVDGYLVKPINEKNLLVQIQKAMLSLDLEKVKSEAKDRETLLEVIYDNSPAGIALVKENIIYTNRALEKITGYTKEELFDINFMDFIKEKNLNLGHIKDISELSHLKEVKITTKDDEIKHIELALKSIIYHDETLHVINMLDVSTRKWYEFELENSKRQLEELNRELQDKNIELKEQLYKDELTSLPNRLRLLEDIKKFDSAVLMLVNIDAFKEINDFYGTDFGDYVIKEVGDRLKNLAEDIGFTIYKMQADEYALLCGDISCSCRRDPGYAARNIHDDVENYVFVQKGQEIHIGLTVGVANESTKSILTKADIALKRAKRGRNPYLVYDDSMMANENFEENFKWVNMLKSALEDRRIVSFFQPILDNKSRKIEKFECLVRLIGKDNNIYSPALFLDISKKSRLYQKITKTMIADAFETFKDSPYTFSINLSIEDILNENNVDFIVENIKRYNNADRLIFEVLESEGIHNYEDVARFVNIIKEMGCKVAIDDFGSGYSNFAHILKLNIDFIKIDASIIRNSDSDENSQIISKTIVKFSQEMGIKTVAEFVHSKEVLDSVMGFGVDYSQGYYIGEPRREIILEPKNILY